MIKFVQKGNFNNTEKFFKKTQNINFQNLLAPYGQMGVSALSSATPIDTGEAASSWNYEITKGSNCISIIWSNSKMAGNTPLVILIQFGHGTGTGGYVQARDFINPAIRPVFDKIANDAWKEVTNL